MSDYEKEIARLNAEISKLKREKEIVQHREVREKNRLKKIIGKERNHRLIVWGAHTEYHLKHSLNIQENEFNDLTDSDVRGILDELYSDLYVRNLVRQIFSRRAKEAAPD